MVSCIFTCTDDLDAEFPAVAARRLGLSAVPLLCAREIDVPGSLPRVIRLLLHCYADPDTEPQHVYLREAVACAATWRAPSEPRIEFNAPHRRDPGLPGGLDLRVRRRARRSSPRTRRRSRPTRRCWRRSRRQLRTLNRYPGPGEGARCAGASRERTGVPAGRIAVGNGSCELLLAAAEAMLEPGAEIVYAWPSFSIYPHLAAMSGARAVTVPLNDDGRARPRGDGPRGHARPRGMVIVCNPNNPSATALPPDAIDAFVAELPRHVAVILDEAYVEFSTLQDPDESLDLLERHPNLVLLRTFSKVYGLCGLRVGYSLGAEDFRIAVDRVRQPFSVNALALAAATEALAHVDELERRVEQTVIERVHVESELAERGPRDDRQPGELLLGLARRPRRGRDRATAWPSAA